MSKLTSLRLARGIRDLFSDSIRADWSNDRHQMIELKSREPDDVIVALVELVELLRAEQWAGELE